MAKRRENKDVKKAETNDSNVVMLIGTVARPNQMDKLCRFTMVCESVTPKGNIAKSYIPVVWFNSGSDETVTEGERVRVNGYLKSGKYEKDGKTIYTLDVVVDEIEF